MDIEVSADTYIIASITVCNISVFYFELHGVALLCKNLLLIKQGLIPKVSEMSRWLKFDQ